MSFFQLEQALALLLLAGTALFAALKGGPAERFGVGMIVAAWVAAVVANAFSRPAMPVLTFLILDGFVTVGFLVIAVRYSSLWLGGAMICQAVSFGAHAMRLSDDSATSRHGSYYYLAITNVVGFLVLFILIGGTFATIARRRRADREKVEDRARIVKRPDWLTDATPPTAGAL
jgi:hypothetical protein